LKTFLLGPFPKITAVGVRGVAFTFGMGMTVGGVLVCSLSVGVQPVFRRLPFSERRLLRALVFVATLDSVVLAVRIVSMFTDSSIRETWTGEPKCFYCYCPPLVWSLSLEESGEPPDRGPGNSACAALELNDLAMVRISFCPGGSSPVGLSKGV
jgi:hypothetical protein